MNDTVLAIQSHIQGLTAPYTNVDIKPKTFPRIDVGLGYRPFMAPERRTEQIAKLRQYYQYYYPQNPFLLEEDVQDICYEHNLKFAPLPLFYDDIPSLNKMRVDEFYEHILRVEDVKGALPFVVDNYQYRKEAEILFNQGLESYYRHLVSTNQADTVEILFEYISGRLNYSSEKLTLHTHSSTARPYFPLSDNIFIFVTKDQSDATTNHVSDPYGGGSFAPLPSCYIPRKKATIGIVLRNPCIINSYTERGADELYYKNMQIGNSDWEDYIESLGDFAPVTENMVCVEIDMTDCNMSWETQILGDSDFAVTNSNTISVVQSLQVTASGLQKALTELYGALMGNHIKVDKPNLKIIAPADSFLQGLQEVAGYRLKPSTQGFAPGGLGDDPIILQPVKYGYLMITQWGNDIPGAGYQNVGAN